MALSLKKPSSAFTCSPAETFPCVRVHADTATAIDKIARITEATTYEEWVWEGQAKGVSQVTTKAQSPATCAGPLRVDVDEGLHKK